MGLFSQAHLTIHHDASIAKLIKRVKSGGLTAIFDYCDQPSSIYSNHHGRPGFASFRSLVRDIIKILFK